MGRLRAGPERDLIADYVQRFDRTGRPLGLGPFSEHEVEDKKNAGMGAEAELLARAVPAGAVLVTLDERGKLISSPEFAAQLARWRDAGRGHDRDGWRGADTRRWNHDWRRDNRYDWRGWRNDHRDWFHLGRYYPPYRGWYYRRLTVGFVLDSLFWGSDYWIADPYYYRLPPAYGPYRWVRYFDDALLVDTYSGQVIDVIYGVFW